jgi:hypothetical protein
MITGTRGKSAATGRVITVRKMTFVLGLGAGYVLGSKAGKERYEQIRAAASRLQENPAVQSAAGVLQQQASDLIATAKAAGVGAVTGRAAYDENRGVGPRP